MVYDEGFDINFESEKINFFVFSKYSANDKKSNPNIKSKWSSHCYSTLIGWFYNANKWGCFYGQKNNVENSEVATNGEAENKLNVLENQISSRDNTNTKETPTFDSVNIFFEKQEKNSIVEPDIVDNMQTESNFLESKNESRIKLTLHSQFKDHSQFVERINAMNLGWKAESYENFSGMTLEQLNNFAGRKKNYQKRMNLLTGKDIFVRQLKDIDTSEPLYELNYPNKFLENSIRKIRNNRIKNVNPSSQNEIEEIEIPEEFLEYKKLMSPARSQVNKKFIILLFLFNFYSNLLQGNCGSCYAASTLSMLEARIRKAYPELVKKYFGDPNDLKLSLKHVLECSVYNQGCDGGYSYLVLKFYKEFEVVLKNCYAQDCNKNCNDSKLNDLSFTISKFGYVGGSYGRCNEKQIMKEVYLNGPLVLSLEPDYSFMFYKSGVYQSPISSWVTKKTKKPEWQKVDHSMVLVGWGVEKIKGKNIKYWLLQNSWGTAWGDNGFIKFIRGIDHLSIESICEYGMPVANIKNI